VQKSQVGISSQKLCRLHQKSSRSKRPIAIQDDWSRHWIFESRVNPERMRNKTGETYYPPMMGPSTGPMKTQEQKTPKAWPPPTGSQMSATIPPTLVNGAHPKRPAKNLVTRSVPMFCARAWPTLKIAKAPTAKREIYFRPSSSDPGPHSGGPAT
jgi:hypothetical protein